MLNQSVASKGSNALARTGEAMTIRQIVDHLMKVAAPSAWYLN